jgi:hypothetical protein
MAGNKRPSFLKRQKEQARLARANEKREARRVKKHSRGMVIEELEAPDPFDSPDPSDALDSLDLPADASEESDENAR